MSRKNKPGFFEKPGFCNRSLPSALCPLPSAFRPLLSSYALLIVTKTSGLRLVCS